MNNRGKQIEEDVLEQGPSYEPEDSGGIELDEPVREERRRSRREGGGIVEKVKANPALTVLLSAGGVLILSCVVFLLVALSKDSDPMSIFQKDGSGGQEGISEEVEGDGRENEYWFTVEEIEALRLAGYTGWEIDEFADAMYDASSLVAQAEAERKRLYEEEMAPYTNAMSPEVAELFQSTYLGLEEAAVQGDPETFVYEFVTKNLDYEKCKATGHQLLLKIYLEDGSYFFMTVEPERWMGLEESGNIVVTMKTVSLPNGGMFITDIAEEVY